MALTQARAFGAGTGGRYGSFAGKGAGEHPVDALTQARAFGAHTGARYGVFSGKTVGRDVDRITQARAFGAHTGMRYGSFANRAEAPAPSPSPSPAPSPGGRRIALPSRVVDDLRARRIREDDVLLLIATQLAAGLIH